MQFTGKTVDETIENGLKELGLSKENAQITIIEQPTKGLFGRLKGKAVVEITKIQSDAERAVEFVQGIIDIMDLKAVAELKGDRENLTITLNTTDSSSIIGYRGEVLDAIQTLAGAVANIGKKDYQKVVVDCENYRDRREETLVKLAHKLEEKAADMRREVILEPMSPFERRIIHTSLSASEKVTTKSEGKEPNRYVVIVPNDKDEFSKPYNAGRSNERSRRDNGRGRGGRGGKGGFKGGKGGRRDSRGGSGFTQEIKKKTPSGFGTYLGNSLKNN